MYVTMKAQLTDNLRDSEFQGNTPFFMETYFDSNVIIFLFDFLEFGNFFLEARACKSCSLIRTIRFTLTRQCKCLYFELFMKTFTRL